VIHHAVEERLGQDAIHTGCRLGAFTQDEGGVTAYFSIAQVSTPGPSAAISWSVLMEFIRGSAKPCFRMKFHRAGTG